MEPGRVHPLSAAEDAAGALEEVMEEDDWVLVKGSRRMKMERIVEELVNRLGKA
jgi:UDP-N-acetylmuramyl pentapeptide synthase